MGRTSTGCVRKKFLESEFQLVFEFVNKVVLPRSEKRTAASEVDFFMMEFLSKFEFVSMTSLMLNTCTRLCMLKRESKEYHIGTF